MTGSILIVIPAFNEDTTISQVVKNCKKFAMFSLLMTDQ